MIVTVTRLLVLAAFVAVVGTAIWKVPLWIAVFLIVLIELLEVFPK